MNGVANKKMKTEKVPSEMHIVKDIETAKAEAVKNVLTDKARLPATSKAAATLSEESMAGFSDISNTTPSTSGGLSEDLERKPKKRKVKSSESSDPINMAICEAINKIISQKEKPDEHSLISTLSDETRCFIEYLGCGLQQIKNKTLEKKCKRELLAVLFKYQDEDDKIV